MKLGLHSGLDVRLRRVVYADLYTDKGGNQQLKRDPYRKCGLN